MDHVEVLDWLTVPLITTRRDELLSLVRPSRSCTDGPGLIERAQHFGSAIRMYVLMRCLACVRR